MKNYFIVIGLAAMSLSVNAQNHISQSFLNVKSVMLSNAVSVSNLVINAGMTNIHGLQYTNLAGTRVVVAAAGDTTAIVGEVQLWADRNGGIPITQIQSVPGTQTNYQQISHITLSGRILGGAAANSAVTFVLTPGWTDVDATTPMPFVATTHDWTVAVTAAAGVVTFATNAPVHMWAGAKYLRVRSMVNGDADATGIVTVQDLRLSGFRP